MKAPSRQCLVPTQEDFHPSMALYGRKWLRMQCRPLGPEGEFWRCGVFGADDFGMVLDADYSGALAAYLAVVGLETVTLADLRELGFEVF